MFVELTEDGVQYLPILIKVDEIVSVKLDYDNEEQMRIVETTKGTYKVKESFTEIKDKIAEITGLSV